VFCTALYFSVVISRQRQQIERLVEEVALLDAEVRERAADPGARSGAIPGAEIVDAAAGQSGRAG